MTFAKRCTRLDARNNLDMAFPEAIEFVRAELRAMQCHDAITQRRKGATNLAIATLVHGDEPRIVLAFANAFEAKLTRSVWKLHAKLTYR